jgi:hypothetical protein
MNDEQTTSSVSALASKQVYEPEPIGEHEISEAVAGDIEQCKPAPQSKYCARRVIAVIRALENGNTRTASFEASGVDYDTAREWTTIFPRFSELVARAEARAEQFYAQSILKGACTDWRAAESWLKRRRRQDWGDAIDVRALPPEQLSSLVRYQAAELATIDAEIAELEAQDAQDVRALPADAEPIEAESRAVA